MLQAAQSLELATNVELLGRLEEVAHAGVQSVVASEDLLRLDNPVEQLISIMASAIRREKGEGDRRRGYEAVLVGPVNVIDGQNCEVTLIAEVAEGDAGAGLDAQLVDGGLVNIKGDGHAEEDPVVEAVVLDDAVPLLAVSQRGFLRTIPNVPIVVLLVHEACSCTVSATRQLLVLRISRSTGGCK